MRLLWLTATLRVSFPDMASSSMREIAVAALSFASALACSDEAGEDVARKKNVNESSLCLSMSMASPSALNVKAWYGCLSSSCDTLISNECAVAVEGTTISVSATAVVESRGNQCTADCGVYEAECHSDPLPAGSYQLVNGEQSQMVTLPLEQPLRAFDTHVIPCD